ncbi:hypothetical protein NDU88_007140 [Pleurodeles waltl]|uniref:Uncharacterized protein n=1 Tax=Pleurodeles waltl TaxID=8319 RepID=A0AAV7PT86_PLEWA|nr:hypothetical protein NDU88_007140 [Pleurodeles waltl]
MISLMHSRPPERERENGSSVCVARAVEEKRTRLGSARQEDRWPSWKRIGKVLETSAPELTHALLSASVQYSYGASAAPAVISLMHLRPPERENGSSVWVARAVEEKRTR